MTRLSSTTRLRILSIAVLAVFAIGSFAAIGQNDQPVPPLLRTEGGSGDPSFIQDMNGVQHKPQQVLDRSPPVFVKGETGIEFHLRYECVRGADLQQDGNCELGDPAGALELQRQVYLHYNVNGTPSSDSTPIALTTTGSTTPGARAHLTFIGTLPASAVDEVKDGVNLTWFVRVPLTGADHACDGSSGSATECIDPLHTSGEEFYEVNIDQFSPKVMAIQPTNPRNAEVFKVGENQWYLYSSMEMSSLLPRIEFSLFDNETGAPLVARNQVEIYRDGTLQNAGPQSTNHFIFSQEGDHNYTYRWNNEAAAPNPGWTIGKAERIDVVVADTAGHELDTQGATNPAVWVIIDNKTPMVCVEGNEHSSCGGASSLEQQSDETFVSPGETPIFIHVRSADIAGERSGGDLMTPTQFLDVTMEFVGPNNHRSSSIAVPYNETHGYHFVNTTLPSDWVNGVTFANITVTDPVGNSISRTIEGNVSVDADKPVIDPKLPLETGDSTLFTKDPATTFRIRAYDPGDEDGWNPDDPQDNDGLGIDHDEVRVRYMIGENGQLRTSQLAAQDAEDIFEWATTFNANDKVYFFFEAKDLAGGTTTYPAAGDPHVPVSGVTANGGRFLLVHIDQAPPSITAVDDIGFIGDPHRFQFNIMDDGSGVDDSKARFHWRVGDSGNFQQVALTKGNATSNGGHIYHTTVPLQEDATEIQYYVRAPDQLGTTASLGSSSSPRSVIVDLTAPTVTVNAPGTATEPRFNVTWSGTDSASGVADYTLQFRVAPDGSWFTVPTREKTTLEAYEMCAANGETYDFRVSVRDRVGNERGFPPVADATTIVDAAASCAQEPELTVSDPHEGGSYSGDLTIEWTAVSTTSPDAVRIDIHAGIPGAYITIGRDLQNSGTHVWQTASLNPADPCLPDGSHTIRVTAKDSNGLSKAVEVPSVTLDNGITDCNDRDGNELPDDWEMAQFGTVGVDPDADPDQDGFSNLQEFLAGTDPTSADSAPATTNGAVSLAGWSNVYILVILAFVATISLFIIGVTRRW